MNKTELLDTIEKLWKEGKSASEIATLVPGNRTRNAIIGIIHREREKNPKRFTSRRIVGSVNHGLASRPSVLPKPKVAAPIFATPKPAPVYSPPPPEPAPVYSPPPPEPAPEARPKVLGRQKPLIETAHDGCKFPTGRDARGHLFCDLQQAEGRPYCANHTLMAYQPAAARPVRKSRPFGQSHTVAHRWPAVNGR